MERRFAAEYNVLIDPSCLKVIPKRPDQNVLLILPRPFLLLPELYNHIAISNTSVTQLCVN